MNNSLPVITTKHSATAKDSPIIILVIGESTALKSPPTVNINIIPSPTYNPAKADDTKYFNLLLFSMLILFFAALVNFSKVSLCIIYPLIYINILYHSNIYFH